MKITTILGSPRKRGNTDAVLRQFEALAGVEHAVTRINVVDVDIRGCLGCDSCFKTPDAPGCVQRDDFLDVLSRIMEADLVVYAAPVYVWEFPAQMKALIDRHYCTVKWQGGSVQRALLEGKRAALLLTCGGGAEENADLMRVAFRRQMEYLRCREAGVYVLGDCESRQDAAERGAPVARQMACDLLALAAVG